MSRRVLYFSNHPIHLSPPCVMEVCTLKDNGYEVFVLTSACTEQIQALFDEKGIVYETFAYKVLPNKLIQKGVNFFYYRKVIRDFFAKYWNDESVFWCGNEGSARKMRPFLYNVHPYIQNCLEFYEGKPYQREMRRICRAADVVTACEPRRAQYMVDWWGLKKMPYIIRNKPYSHPRGRYVEGSTQEVRDAIAKIKGKKCIMYQGAISSDRDLSFLARALKAADSEYYLVLSGLNHDNTAEQLAAIYPRTIFLGNIPTPLHLEVTSHATICVAFYVDNCINNRHCAPNKIYEYAGCGVPMLCNNIPGLMDTVGEAGAGVCVDFNDQDAILAAIQQINDNYDAYCQASTAFYDATDNAKVLDQIMDEAFALTKRNRK